ncbi:MAG: hypothetical protein INR66_22885 [Gordonia polyisoprenivorans]|nr:hypothetical protein [Gordonia polyisoprenivorans]
MQKKRTKSSDQWLLVGIAIIALTLGAIGMGGSAGRGATLSVVGLPFGVVAIIVGIVQRTRGR